MAAIQVDEGVALDDDVACEGGGQVEEAFPHVRGGMGGPEVEGSKVIY